MNLLSSMIKSNTFFTDRSAPRRNYYTTDIKVTEKNIGLEFTHIGSQRLLNLNPTTVLVVVLLGLWLLLGCENFWSGSCSDDASNFYRYLRKQGEG